jgi:hypothetical protein
MEEDAWDLISGGRELIDYFGHVPMFHDGEVVQMVLNRRNSSSLAIHIWGMGEDHDTKHAVVTLTITEIIDLELNGFSPQNVIGDLLIRPLPSSDRAVYYARRPLPTDVEIELVPIYGLSGVIRAGSVSVNFTPGKPDDARL